MTNRKIALGLEALIERDWKLEPAPFAAPLADPRSHPLTRTLGEGIVTAGRGQAPNAATFAPLKGIEGKP